MFIHATCVAIRHRGVVIAGPPGSGKSDLALRLIDDGAILVADDQVELRRTADGLVAFAPPALAGLLEVRQVGILRLPPIESAPVALYIELSPDGARLPDPDPVFLLDHAVPRLRLMSFAASTPAKIRAALSFPLQS